jgi:leucyl-tRNA synthetase
MSETEFNEIHLSQENITNHQNQNKTENKLTAEEAIEHLNNLKHYFSRESSVSAEALTMAIEALQSQTPTVTDEEIENKTDDLLIEQGHHPSRVRHPIYGEERTLGVALAKWMRNKLTPNK